MKEYQRGIYDLMMLLRKYGVVFRGSKGLEVAYSDFLATNGIKRYKPSRTQVKIMAELQERLRC
ncbi:hypothetical protein LCGC14_3162350 [marine sediment metagenome]|uniref:Uncharacterized protein n=1 Tax=marine sediment metagenome TaxID=412755 RepID=A0A0F8XXK6_9ZZZZ